MNIQRPLPVIAPIFFVECDFGRIGKAFIECDRDKSSFGMVVADIVQGQIEKPIKILEIIEAENSCRDITEDVAREVHFILQVQSSPCPDRLREFIDEHVGMSKADELDAEGV